MCPLIRSAWTPSTRNGRQATAPRSARSGNNDEDVAIEAEKTTDDADDSVSE
jgi:hypothetical protein